MGFEAKPDAPSQQKFVPDVDPAALNNLPDYWDWRDQGVIHDVQDQKSCSDCYIFATIASIEAHACLYGNSCDKLSEQEALSEILNFRKIKFNILKSLDCNNGNKCKAGHPEIVYNYSKNILKLFRNF